MTGDSSISNACIAWSRLCQLHLLGVVVFCYLAASGGKTPRSQTGAFHTALICSISAAYVTRMLSLAAHLEFGQELEQGV